jgi:hypothetical protein
VARWKVECTVGDDVEVEAEHYREGNGFIELTVTRGAGHEQRQEVVFAARKDTVRTVRKLPQA